MRLVRKTRCFRFLGFQDSPTSNELRGASVFHGLRTALTLRRLVGGHGRVSFDPVITQGRECPDELLFAVMPGQDEFAGYLEWRRRRPHLVNVIDVTADVLGLTELAHGVRCMSAEGVAFWNRQDVLLAHQRALFAADVITTSWEELVEPLELAVPGPRVVHLPDHHRGDKTYALTLRDVFRGLRR